MVVLNTAVASQLMEFKQEVDLLLQNGMEKEEAVLRILRDYVVKLKPVLFEGNNYSQEWKNEAQRRGLSNIDNVPDAIKAFASEESVRLFEVMNVHSRREIDARVEVYAENYTKKIQIESRVLGDLAINHIIPTAIRYQNILIENVKGLKEIFSAEEFNQTVGLRTETIKSISECILDIRKQVNEMIEERKKANKIEETMAKAEQYNHLVKPYLSSIRVLIDRLELIVDDEMWPLPKYRELLFSN